MLFRLFPLDLPLLNSFLVGGDKEDRTPDLRLAKPPLSQLSYIPIKYGGEGGIRTRGRV